MNRYVIDRLLLVGAVLAMAGTVLAVRPGGSALPSRTLTVSGTGTMPGTPDILNVAFNVTSSDPVANTALSKNNALAGQLISDLKSAGVDGKDITTSGLSVSRNYDYTGQNQNQPYTASESVQVILRNLNNAGTLISLAANAAGDSIRINAMTPAFSDQGTSLAAAARVMAVDNAKAIALSEAKAAGASLGQVKVITDQNVSNPVFRNISDGLSAGSAQNPVPVQVGQQNLSVTVNVQYDLT